MARPLWGGARVGCCILGGPACAPAAGTFYQSTLVADAFLDPSSDDTQAIFRRMVEDVTAGRERISQSIATAREALSALLR